MNHATLITANELAQLAAVSKATLTRDVRLGRQPHVRIGGRLMFSPAQVQHFLRRRSYPQRNPWRKLS